MNTHETIKETVRKKYDEIARQDKLTNAASCCGAGGCSTDVYNIMSEDYSSQPGYEADADLALGCGLPVWFARIKSGDLVVDLGSGAGNDCFVARHETGPSGKVIGIDFTEIMIEKARDNAHKAGLHNVEFRLGDIENIPVGGNQVDVVVSNCVLNLVPDKAKAFNEIFRILKPGGHFSISDVVTSGTLPQNLHQAAEMYAGCVTGAMIKDEYLDIIRQSGFESVLIEQEKPIYLPDDILSHYMNANEIAAFRALGTGIMSVTVFGKKAAENVCTPGGGCC
jgi:ubiquinone/menaquinone biosynthesis C-methylase UbiE